MKGYKKTNFSSKPASKHRNIWQYIVEVFRYQLMTKNVSWYKQFLFTVISPTKWKPAWTMPERKFFLLKLLNTQAGRSKFTLFKKNTAIFCSSINQIEWFKFTRTNITIQVDTKIKILYLCYDLIFNK